MLVSFSADQGRPSCALESPNERLLRIQPHRLHQPAKLLALRLSLPEPKTSLQPHCKTPIDPIALQLPDKAVKPRFLTLNADLQATI